MALGETITPHLYICVYTHIHTLLFKKHFIITINLYNTVLLQLATKVAGHPEFVNFLPTLLILSLILG